MNTPTRILISVCVALVAIGVALAVVPNTRAQEQSGNEAKIEYLYVQTAHGVSFKGDKMTLYGISPTTLFFSDRPQRIAGRGTTEECVKGWAEGPDSFAQDPPNATLSVLEVGDSNVEDIVVELRDPVLEAGQLTYRVKILEGEALANGGACALFIDIVGMPLTPVSVAGVARRTTRRAVLLR